MGFPPPQCVNLYQDGTFDVTTNATASSDLPVSFAVASGPATMSGSNTVTLTGAGSVTITASQAGNTNYLAADSVTQSFTVGKGAALVTLDGLTQTYDGSNHVVTATTFPAGLTVGITYNGSETAPIAVGTYAVTGTVNEVFYDGWTNGILTIAKAAQTITFDSLTNKMYGDAPFDLIATASSGLPVTFTVTNGPATLSNNWVTITGTGTVSIVASQAGDAN